MTNTDTMKLNLDEMDMVNGGWNWDRFSAGSFFGGVVACGAACLAIASMATPVGWVAAGAAVVGATAAGTGLGAGISSIINVVEDD